MPRIKPYTLEYDAPRTCNTPIKLPRDTWQQTFSTSEPIISHHITPVHEVKCSIRRTPTTYLHGSTPKTVARPVALSVVNGRRMPRSLLYLLSSAKEEPPASHQEECHFRNPSQNSIEVAPIIHCPGPSVDHPLSWEDRYKFISEITSVFLGSHEIIENCMRRSIDRYSDRKGLMRGVSTNLATAPPFPLPRGPSSLRILVYNHLLRTVPHEAFTVSTLTGENMKEDLTYIEKKVAEVKHLNESIKASFQKLYNKSYQTAIGMWPNWCDVAFDLTYGVRANILPYLTPIQTNTYCFDNLDEWSRAVDVMSSIYVKWNTCCEREKGGLNEAMRDIEAPHFKLFTVLPEAQSSDPAIYQIQAEPHPVTSMPYENLQQIADFTKCWVDICVQRQMEAIQLSEERERNNIRLSSDEEIESALYHFREAYKLQRGLSKDASVYYGGTFGLSNGATKVSCAIRTPTSYLQTETTITSLPKHHPSVIVDKSNDNITIPSTVQSILDISCTQLSKVDIVYNNMGALNLFLDGDISVKEMLSYSVTRDLWLSELIWSHMTVRTPSPNSTHYLLSTESDGRMSIDIMQTLEGCCESPAKEKSVISGILPFNCHVLSSFVNSDLIKKGSFVVLSVFEQDLLIQFHKFLLNFSTNSLSCSAAYASEVGDMYGRICDDSINRRAILSDRRIACSKKSKLLRLQHKNLFMNISLSDIEDTSKLIVEGPTREWARVKEWFNELAQEYETPHKWNESNKEPPPVGLARWIGVGSESSLASVPEFAREMRAGFEMPRG